MKDSLEQMVGIGSPKLFSSPKKIRLSTTQKVKLVLKNYFSLNYFFKRKRSEENEKSFLSKISEHQNNLMVKNIQIDVIEEKLNEVHSYLYNETVLKLNLNFK